MTGFTVRKPPPAAPQPVAAPLPCGEKHPERSAYCTRPEGHKGAHKDDANDAYWQAAEAKP